MGEGCWRQTVDTVLAAPWVLREQSPSWLLQAWAPRVWRQLLVAVVFH